MTDISLGDFPSGSLLLYISFLDSVFSSVNVPHWRNYLPFGLGDPETEGYLSYELPGKISDSYPELPTFSNFLSSTDLPPEISSMFKFAKTPTTSLGDVTSRDSLLVLCVLVFLLRLVKGVLIPFFCSCGREIGRRTHGLQWEKENEDRITKFGEYVFRLIYHSTISAFGLWYFWDKDWWDPAKGGTNNLYQGYPHHSIETGMVWYYLVQCAYNIEAMLSLVELSFSFTTQSPISARTRSFQTPLKIEWSPKCRGDFPEMFAHHVITNILVISSSYCRFTRVGSMVFVVHDISDVPVDMSKLANFMKWKLTTIICFALLVLVWFVTRLVVLPFVIVKSVFICSKVLYQDGSMDPVFYKMYIPLFQYLLLAITALHMLWFFMLIRIGYRLVTKGETHDLTEHKQGEEHEKKEA